MSQSETLPKLYSYVVARDYGFAPNPFRGFCTLATCKPKIRKTARVNDWIVGTGSKGKDLQDRIVYAMQVSEAMTFNEYWQDPRFILKRLNLHSSISNAFGDNIYYRNAAGEWEQADSHHSYAHGRPNRANIQHDTNTDRVLIARNFAYWGGNGPKLPQFAGIDIRKDGQGHRCRFSPETVAAFIKWFRELSETGVLADPADWRRR